MPAFEPWSGPGSGPDPAGFASSPEVYARATATTGYNPVGTCRMGIDDYAVVAADLSVHGVSGLRIADASVIPVVPNVPVHATVVAIAERAARFIQTQGRIPVEPAPDPHVHPYSAKGTWK